MPDMTVTRNEADHRYEARVADGVATIAYRRRDDVDPPVVTMTRTEVPEGARGEGVGGELVRRALDDVRKRGEKVLPECPYVNSWLQEHPGYQDLTTPETPGAPPASEAGS